ncbi:MAG: carbonic anhydrase [Oscillospiraceae bacterium]
MIIKRINNQDDIPNELINTPIESLIQYQNFAKPFEKYDTAKLLVGMCMDNRKQLKMPENFAYIIRTGGANLRYCEFKVSYAIAIGKLDYIVLIAHDKCGMVNLVSKFDSFVEGLCRLENWDEEKAKEHFYNYAPMYEIENEIEFVVNESRRLSQKYIGVTVVPLYYTLDDNQLCLIVD